MADIEIREWTAARMKEVMEGRTLTFSREPVHPLCNDRVNLGAISTKEMRRELSRLYHGLKTRHATELHALDNAFKAETARIAKFRTKSVSGRVIGALATLTGLSGALQKHRASSGARRLAAFDTERQAILARHKQEGRPLSEQCRELDIREKHHSDDMRRRAREMNLPDRFNDEGFTPEQKTGRRYIQIQENAKSITEKRRNKRDGDDEGPKNRNKRGKGYGYRRGR